MRSKNGFYRTFPALFVFVVGFIFLCLIAACYFFWLATNNQRNNQRDQEERIIALAMVNK
jgi:nitrogen fixation-related uncharacterized protein